MTSQAENAERFYTGIARYMETVDPEWVEDRWRAQLGREREILRSVLGEAHGRSVLDCSCGDGGQAIPLAQLGWQVAATDITDDALETARYRVKRQGLDIDFRVCDMRHLGTFFKNEFDQVITCMALDNIASEDGIRAAVRGMFGALKPGGQLYIRQRDFDHLMRARPRYEIKEERTIPHGRVIRMEDWEYESETHVVYFWLFLREDDRREVNRWAATAFRLQRRALRKAELEIILRAVGFDSVEFLSQPSPWHPYEVVAGKAGP